MRKSLVASISLGLLLVATNAWWFYQSIDSAVTASYRDQELHEHEMALQQALSLLPKVTSPSLHKTEFITLAAVANDPVGPFEKEGYVWIDSLGFQFNGSGQLTRATTVWSGD